MLAGFDPMVFVLVWCNVPRLIIYDCAYFANFQSLDLAITGHKSFLATCPLRGGSVSLLDGMGFVGVYYNEPRLTFYEYGLRANFERFSRALVVFMRLIACFPLDGVCRFVSCSAPWSTTHYDDSGYET